MPVRLFGARFHGILGFLVLMHLIYDYGDFFNVMNINEMLMMLMIVMVNGVRQLGASLIEKIESSRSLAWQQQQNDDHDHIIRITVKGEAILKQKETEAERGEVCL